MVMRDRMAHCMSGALFGAAALRMIGHPPLLLGFEAVRTTITCSPSSGSAGIGVLSPRADYSGVRYR